MGELCPGTTGVCGICGAPVVLAGFGDKDGPFHDRWIHDDDLDRGHPAEDSEGRS